MTALKYQQTYFIEIKLNDKNNILFNKVTLFVLVRPFLHLNLLKSITLVVSLYK